jgi:predicted DNA-binding transcriptional regulator YafY
MCVRDRANKYYIEDRSFDVAELRVLLDCVQSAKFITAKKTEDLVTKIAELAGSNRGEVLKRNIVWLDTVKYTNEAVYYNIDTLNTAIAEGKRVSFRYFDLDESGQKVYRKDGEKYLVSPIALIFNSDKYYLIEYNEKHSSLVNYRVDKMESCEMLGEDIGENADRQKAKIPTYKSELFDMFNGQKRVAEFLADASMVDVVLDKFGSKVHFTKEGDKVRFRVNVHDSPTFYSWITIFGRRIRLVGDKILMDNYRRFLEEARESYDEALLSQRG